MSRVVDDNQLKSIVSECVQVSVLGGLPSSSTTEPASGAAATTYESANGHTTVTSQVTGYPAC